MIQLKQPKGKGVNKFQRFADSLGPLVYSGLKKRGFTKKSTFDNVMSQLAFESTYGTSDLAKRAHNYGGYGYNGKDYHYFKDDAAFVNAYLNDMAGKYKKALYADTVQDYAKELKRIGYFEAPLDQYTNNLAGMSSIRKAASKYYNQPMLITPRPVLQPVQIPSQPVSPQVQATIQHNMEQSFRRPVLQPIGNGPAPEIDVPEEQSSPFMFTQDFDLPPIEQTMGALINNQPMLTMPTY